MTNRSLVFKLADQAGFVINGKAVTASKIFKVIGVPF